MSTSAFRLWYRLAARRPQGTGRWPLSIFEKVIVANSTIILLETIAGWWITQHNPETYHYLIDTGFIALAALLGMTLNFLLLRAAFAPLHGVLATIRAVEAGDLEARASARASDADVLALARAFNAMLDRLALARQEAAGRVLRAQEEEQRRLALELHDQIGQSLTALTLHAEAMRERVASEPGRVTPSVQRQAERLIALASRTLAEVQALSRQLRPPLLDDIGLVAALRWLANDVRERFGSAGHVQVHLAAAERLWQAEADGWTEESSTTEPDTTPDALQTDLARLPGEVETDLFRIAQESVTNAIRHGRAGQIHLTLWRQERQVCLTIADDGEGLTPSTEAGRGMGLAGMRERAQLLGGTLRVHSRPGDGCVVRVGIPLPGAPAATGTEAKTAPPGTDLLVL